MTVGKPVTTVGKPLVGKPVTDRTFAFTRQSRKHRTESGTQVGVSNLDSADNKLE